MLQQPRNFSRSFLDNWGRWRKKQQNSGKDINNRTKSQTPTIYNYFDFDINYFESKNSNNESSKLNLKKVGNQWRFQNISLNVWPSNKEFSRTHQVCLKRHELICFFYVDSNCKNAKMTTNMLFFVRFSNSSNSVLNLITKPEKWTLWTLLVSPNSAIEKMSKLVWWIAFAEKVLLRLSGEIFKLKIKRINADCHSFSVLGWRHISWFSQWHCVDLF